MVSVPVVSASVNVIFLLSGWLEVTVSIAVLRDFIKPDSVAAVKSE